MLLYQPRYHQVLDLRVWEDLLCKHPAVNASSVQCKRKLIMICRRDSSTVDAPTSPTVVRTLYEQVPNLVKSEITSELHATMAGSLRTSNSSLATILNSVCSMLWMSFRARPGRLLMWYAVSKQQKTSETPMQTPRTFCRLVFSSASIFLQNLLVWRSKLRFTPPSVHFHSPSCLVEHSGQTLSHTSWRQN